MWKTWIERDREREEAMHFRIRESETEASQGNSPVYNLTPLVKFGGHKDEGYAIYWSPVFPGRLASGILGTARVAFICGNQRLVQHGMLIVNHLLVMLQVWKIRQAF